MVTITVGRFIAPPYPPIATLHHAHTSKSSPRSISPRLRHLRTTYRSACQCSSLLLAQKITQTPHRHQPCEWHPFLPGLSDRECLFAEPVEQPIQPRPGATTTRLAVASPTLGLRGVHPFDNRGDCLLTQTHRLLLLS